MAADPQLSVFGVRRRQLDGDLRAQFQALGASVRRATGPRTDRRARVLAAAGVETLRARLAIQGEDSGGRAEFARPRDVKWPERDSRQPGGI